MKHFRPEELWRAIILYGRNSATYKIALGHCLLEFARRGLTDIPLELLAQEFFSIYNDRLKTEKPQLVTPNRRTVMETIVDLYNGDRLDESEAIERVANEAFGDVIPRFHTVHNFDLPLAFYEQTDRGLIISDRLIEIANENDIYEALHKEVGSRWDLLEAAFEMNRKDSVLTNDIRRIYLQRGHKRTNITDTHPVLNGYQDGICFYCGEEMVREAVHVDHVIPRQLVHHDDIWNLVLAHDFCNTQKSDALPGRNYIEKLIARNEYFIASNHPIKPKLVKQVGSTREARERYTWQVYRDAETVIGYTWEGIRGYNPETDPFFKTFIRSLYT